MIATRIERGVTRIHDPAVIDIGAQFTMLFGPRDQLHIDLEPFRLVHDALRQCGELLRIVRRMEASDDAEVAVEFLRRDEFANPRQRALAFA